MTWSIAMKSLFLALAFVFFAPACIVRTPGVELRSVAVSYESRSCPKNRVWNGERCVKRRGHHHHKHHWHRHHH
jgi:hypothetical protein